MIKPKVLSDSAWKDVLAKNKGVKDNGLLKTLADIKKLGDGDHDDAQAILDQIQKLAAQLKKSKEIAATPAVSKFLAELTGAADTAVRDVAKAKAEAEKAAKAKAEVDKRAQAGAAKRGDEDDEDEESPELLTNKLKLLLRQVAQGEMMHTLVAKSGKRVVVLMSRKPIPPGRRKLLAEQLGGGGAKYYPGYCALEAGATTFVLKAQVAGMSKLIKAALLEQTGLRVSKVKCRGDDGDDHDDDVDADAPPDFVPGVEIEDRDARRDTLNEGGDEPPEFVPGVETSEPTTALAAAPQVWKGTRQLLQTNINALKSVVQAQLSDEGADFIDEINGYLEKLDRITNRLDRRLITTLTKALEEGPATRSIALQEAKGILAEYIRYVASEPLIDHLDKNPFGVKTDLKATLTKSLTHMAKAIG